MRRVLGVIAICVFALPAFAKSPTPPKPPGYVIQDSEVLTLPVNAAGRHYALFVGLPPSYKSDPTRKYPVIYCTDGYWDFQKITAIAGTLVYDKMMPEVITVGMGYAGDKLDYGDMRRWELSPVPNGDPATSGHAKEFLDT